MHEGAVHRVHRPLVNALQLPSCTGRVSHPVRGLIRRSTADAS